MNITGGIYNRRKLVAPDKEITRPTLSKVRMGVFNTLYSLIGKFEQKSFLDLFGGSGIMGLEAISRGFSDIYVFEKNPKAVQVIKNNYKQLKLIPKISVGDSLKLVKQLDKKFDVIYIDPPYESEIYQQSFAAIKHCIKDDTVIIAEHSEDIIIEDYTLTKSKNYGGKKLSFYKIVNW